jgi:hypothetical protein
MKSGLCSENYLKGIQNEQKTFFNIPPQEVFISKMEMNYGEVDKYLVQGYNKTL